MTREIKFRAWDKIQNVMFIFDIYNVPPYVGQTYLVGEKFERIYEIMQYTGLKDKNGTPICEGDVLSTDLSRPYLVVEFRNGAFMFQCHHNGQDYYNFMTSADEGSNFTKYHEVLGNIHEHKHLLGGVDK